MSSDKDKRDAMVAALEHLAAASNLLRAARFSDEAVQYEAMADAVVALDRAKNIILEGQ